MSPFTSPIISVTKLAASLLLAFVTVELTLLIMVAVADASPVVAFPPVVFLITDASPVRAKELRAFAISVFVSADNDCVESAGVGATTGVGAGVGTYLLAVESHVQASEFHFCVFASYV
jgi:hypothetical protein